MKEYPNWIMRRIENGTATTHPHGTFTPRKSRNLRDTLQGIHCEKELYGLANRRKVTGVDLPRWSDSEKELIKERLWQLRNKK